jgi:hypothetical protein
LRLISVEALEGQGVSEKSAHNSGTENCHPIRGQSHFCRNSHQGSEQVFFICTRFMIMRDITSKHILV